MSFSAPPRLSGGLPLVGHGLEFMRSASALLFRAQVECGDAAAFSVFNRRFVAVYGPEMQEAVFRAPDSELTQADAYRIMTPVFGKDVVYDAAPERMAEQLGMLVPALREQRMRRYADAVASETERHIAGWGVRGTIDLLDLCGTLTSYTSTRCLLGREFREEMTSEFASAYQDLERGVTPLAYLNPHLPIPAFRRRDRARAKLVEMTSAIVGKRRERGSVGEDFLQTLMESRYSNGQRLSEHEITGLLLAAMFAGHDTSSATTAWTIIELVRHPEVMRRVVAEIDGTFGSGHRIDHDALRQLSYTENVIKETLRLHPPLYLLIRTAKHDMVLRRYRVAKGTWIAICPLVAHRLPEVFADPDRFDPERFASPREEDKRPYTFIAFGGGRHACLGSSFALLQIKAILAFILGRYEVDLLGDAVAPDFTALVVGPKRPCRIGYRRRDSPSAAARD